MKRFAFTLSLLLAALPVLAQEEKSEAMVVLVPGQKVVLWQYRTLDAGVSAFERHRAMAPDGLMHFKLRTKGEHADFAGVSLGLVGAGWEMAVPLDERGRFVLARVERADSDNAQLVVAGTGQEVDVKSSPRIEVRTPGLPANVLRMGDLRLECQAMQAMAKKHLGIVFTLTLNAIGGIDWCSPRKDNARYAAYPSQPFVKVVLVEGERRLTLWEGKERRSQSVPLHDSSWSHEALIEFTSAQAPAP